MHRRGVMCVRHGMRTGLAILAIGLACAPTMAQEMESDERGAWVADVNPTTLEMLVTDCPCDSIARRLEPPALIL